LSSRPPVFTSRCCKLWSATSSGSSLAAPAAARGSQGCRRSGSASDAPHSSGNCDSSASSSSPPACPPRSTAPPFPACCRTAPPPGCPSPGSSQCSPSAGTTCHSGTRSSPLSGAPSSLVGHQAVTLAVEQPQPVVASGLEVAVVGAVLLLAVDRDLG